MKALEHQNTDQPDPRFMLSRLADFRTARIDCSGFEVTYDTYGMIKETRCTATDEVITLSPVERVCLWEDYLAHLSALFAQGIWEAPVEDACDAIAHDAPCVTLEFLLNISGLSVASPFRRPRIDRPCPYEAIDLRQIRARFPYLSVIGHTIPSLAAELALLLIHTELLDHITPLKREKALTDAAAAIMVDHAQHEDHKRLLATTGAFPLCTPPDITTGFGNDDRL